MAKSTAPPLKRLEATTKTRKGIFQTVSGNGPEMTGFLVQMIFFRTVYTQFSGQPEVEVVQDRSLRAHELKTNSAKLLFINWYQKASNLGKKKAGSRTCQLNQETKLMNQFGRVDGRTGTICSLHVSCCCSPNSRNIVPNWMAWRGPLPTCTFAPC